MTSENSKIIFHTNCLPDTDYFKQTRVLAGDRFYINRIAPEAKAWDRNLKEPIKMSDFFRLLILLKFGGIYSDLDLIFIKPHAEFYTLNVTSIAIESSVSLANGFMITPPKSKIMLRWLLEYKKFDNFHMGTFSVLKIWSLWQKFPDEINAVQNIFVRPNWREIDLLVDYFNWQKSHNVHLSLRFVAGKMKFPTVEEKHKFLTNVTDIDCLENSLGEILRYTVYGHERLC